MNRSDEMDSGDLMNSGTNTSSDVSRAPSAEALYRTVSDLARAWRRADLPGAEQVAARLAGTVVRPLRELTPRPPETPGTGPEPGPATGPVPGVSAPPRPDREQLESDLLELALALTRRCITDPHPGLLEACAGAHRLVADVFGEPDTADSNTAELLELARLAAEIPAGPRGRLVVRTDGPYLLVGGPVILSSWLGEPIARPPVAALCRCGRSGSRPWCDGTHAEVGFSGAKLDTRVPDRIDTYPARQFEIRDNRGLCAHSGFCTDALPTAFRVAGEPFVAPAGARADDIFRAVQSCPSGALRVAHDDSAPPDLADTAREPGVEVSLDGPYRVTGGVDLVDDSGTGTARAPRASLEHYSLCRCGHSANKPLCSGAHWYADFHDPVPDPDTEPTLFAWAGGYPALLRMTRLFYERHVAADELLAPLFARMEPDHPERVAAWLSEVFGGPELYSRRYGGYPRMLAQHLNKHLGETQRARWVALLARSADEAGLPTDPEFRAAFTGYLEWGSRLAVENSRSDAEPPPNMPVPKWWWVCNTTPVPRPTGGAAAQPEPEPPPLPAEGETVGFAQHIQGLFRARDRGAMRFAFDLHSADDVTRHADAILAKLRDGSMPCDGVWPDDRIAVFARWIEQGTRP
ncbi:MAG TPA: CDGSH iron-sulfur domain-containing protein [Pseudonocardia sp.]|nr:CDGSH iron-sulfur domain-containing protein [Pseudonocardia sp.]